MAKPCDWLIVGGGAFGTAIANSLARRQEDRIIWYSGSTRPTASLDKSKIVRTSYPVPGYIRWAQSALSKWKADKLYTNFFHESGWIRVVGRESRDDDRKISSEDMQQMVGSDQEPRLDSNEILRFNSSIGSVDYDLALDAAAKQASNLGVERREEDITKLFVQDGICVGVVVSGEIVKAKKIIVAAGPWTPELLEKSGVYYPPNFFQVVAVPVATMLLTEEELAKLGKMPIIVTSEGEIMLSVKDKSLKITSTNSFSIEHPDKIVESVDIKSNLALLHKMLPQFATFATRNLKGGHCVDLMTPNQHPLLDAAQETQNLFLATAGNFHWAKFLTEGEVMLKVLESRGNGKTYASDPVLTFALEKCGWDWTKGETGAHENMVPSGNS